MSGLNKALKEQELISLNIDFYELILNSNSLGVYVMQEVFLLKL